MRDAQSLRMRLGRCTLTLCAPRTSSLTLRRGSFTADLPSTAAKNLTPWVLFFLFFNLFSLLIF